MADSPNNPPRKASILVIDDDAGPRQLLEDLLALEGYEVRTAASGELGLALVAAEPPDLILVDMRMPGMDGPQFCRRIKGDPLRRHIPVMIVSGLRDMKEQLEGFEAGAADFVLKPFHRKVLLARVQTHLELSQLRLRFEHQVDERTCELRQANHQERLAVQKAEGLGVLAAGIAHDFNNLLGVIYAEADLALSRLDSGLSARDHIQNINSVASRAAGIVDLLTTYAASGSAPAVEAVDLSAAVEEMLRLMRCLLATRHRSVICRLGANLPPARANGHQVSRIIMNLLVNAAEVLEDEGGSITVSTALIRVPQGQSAAPANLAEGNYVSLAVSDTGPGMSGEILARAMDPFFTTKSLGRGMGLAVVQGIVRSHGGAIRVSSSAGQGSTFEVLLPCAAEHVGETASARPSDVPPLQPTILLVEDEQTLRKAVAGFLKQRGMKIVSASEGREALEKLLDPAQKIDVVLLDVTLPDMSGFDVLAEMRKLKPDVKIVLTSAHELDARNPNIIEGASRPTFIHKPYRLNELLRVLRKEIESGVTAADLLTEQRAAK